MWVNSSGRQIYNSLLLFIWTCRISFCWTGRELLLADVAPSIQCFAFTTLITPDIYCVWIIVILSKEKFSLCLFSIFSSSRMRKINGVGLLKCKKETMVILHKVSLTKSLPLGTDGCVGGNKKKGKGGALWETDATSPTHTQTLPFRERTASSFIPPCLWQRRVKTLPRMWLYFKKHIRGFPLLISLFLRWINQKKQNFDVLKRWLKGRFGELSPLWVCRLCG